jgi:sugar lactone lactonase YvrE
MSAWFSIGCLVLAAGYPKTNLAVGYAVDPDWPQKPPEITWRYMAGVAVDSKDQVWTLNAVDPPVQVYDKSGSLIKTWGNGLFKGPHYLRIDHEGNIWIADYSRHVVRKFTPDGEVLLTLGTMDEPGDDDLHLSGPTDMAISPAGDVFVTDGYGNNRVVHYDAQGRFVKTWGKLGVDAGDLSQPHSIAMDSQGRLYVAERNNARIQLFDQDGNSLAQWRHLINPWGIWISPRDEIYVCGSAPARWTERGNLGNPPTDQLLIKFDTTGRALELSVFPMVQNGKMETGKLDWVHGIAVDSEGNLYLSDVADDSPAHRVQKFSRLPAER